MWKTDNFNSDICKIILAVILPPLGVFLERGCGADLLINILLTILGYIPGKLPRPSASKPASQPAILTATPGIIHALYIILKY